MQDGVVEVARQRQRPEACTLRHHGFGRSGRRRCWAAQGQGRDAFGALERDRKRAVVYAVGGKFSGERRKLDAGALGGARRKRRKFLGARGNRFVEFRARDRGIDQAPLDRALALDAFFGGAEHVGEVAPHFALVGDPGQPAGAGQNREQRQFRQRHRGGAIVDQHDVVGGERQFVAAAGGGAVDGADRFDTGMLAQVLDAVPRLVGELAEIDFVGVACAGQHADIGAGAEHPWLCRPQHQRAHLRMLEAQPLQRVGELDIDAEIVGIQFQIVAFEQAGLLVDVHRQPRHIAVDGELPMAVTRGLGLEIDASLSVSKLAVSELAARRLAVSERALRVIRVAHDNASASSPWDVYAFM